MRERERDSFGEPPHSKGKERKVKAILKLCSVSFGRILGPFCPILAQFVPYWGYRANLGLSLAPRGHLEPSWGLRGAKSFLEHLVLKSTEPRPADSRDSGGKFGAQNWSIFCYCWGHVLNQFLDIFWSTFVQILGSLFGTRWAKMGSKSPLRVSKSQKPAFAKNLKTLCFSLFLGFQGRPRQPQEAHEGSQEAPKELQRL